LSHGLKMGFMEDLRAKNAERLAIREQNDLIGKKYGLKKVQSFPTRILSTDWKVEKLSKMLDENGVLGLEGALSQETASRLLDYISRESETNKRQVEGGEVDFDDRFGGVNCRGDGMFGKRQDQFLPLSDDIVREACAEAMGNMLPLLEATMTPKAALHEVSSLVADPGAPRQCIHADTIVLPCPQYPDASMKPLYTFFIALQDVEDGMGHTTFLPRTHTPDAHLLWNLGQKQKESLISSLPAVESGLKTGDVVIFDSRCLHAGGANTSNKRRVLFYFTLSEQKQWPLPDGLHGSNSIRRKDFEKWHLADLVREAGVAR